jgi:hypothetical protein
MTTKHQTHKKQYVKLTTESQTDTTKSETDTVQQCKI